MSGSICTEVRPPEGKKEKAIMKIRLGKKTEEGKVGWILLWLLGVPLPLLLVLFLVRGCT